jgi:transposase-like protein
MSHSEPTQTNAKDEQEVQVPKPEVLPRAKRRRFSAEYKQRILEEADSCTERGQIGALLRREGLYSSHLSKWRRQRSLGQLEGLSPKKRGRKPQDPSVEEMARLRRENERLRARLEQAEMIIDVQKKLSQLLGLTPDETGTDEST